MLLQSIRILAMENGLAGPICSRLLADLGAEVIKVERPGAGDVTRGWDTAAASLSSGFVWVNRGKRSVALDVKSPAARVALERLIERSDVFLQNFAPGWAARVGLDEPSVRAIRPDVVYSDISGYGLDGPYAHKSAYDLVVQGEAGLIALNGSPTSPPGSRSRSATSAPERTPRSRRSPRSSAAPRPVRVPTSRSPSSTR